MENESNQHILSELEQTKEFIQQNWCDPISSQYIIWLTRAEEKIRKMERRRELIRLEKEKIQILCEAAINDDAGDSHKTRSRIR